MPPSEKEILSPKRRAEDILLGALGFGEDASIQTIEKLKSGYRGRGRFADGEEFDFQSEDELSDLELWALGILTDSK